MTLRVSIVTYHTPDEELHNCLGSMSGCTCIDAIDIIDNSSDPRTERFCRGLDDPTVNYIPNGNVGYGAGNNISIRESLRKNVDYHLVLNSDVYFTAEELEKCLEYMDRHSDTGQLIPHVTYRDGSYQPVCHRIPTPADLILHRFLPRAIARKWFDNYELRSYDLNRPLNAPYHHGCFMLLRVSALRETGLFDERFFMYPEDIDLTRRIHERYKTIYFPGASIIHDHRAASRKDSRMLKIHATNMLRYFRKWGFIFDRNRRLANREFRKELSAMRRDPGGV